MKVRLKQEIVTMGEPDIGQVNKPVNMLSLKLNKPISDPDVLVVDTRNSYETAIGQFRGATDPQTPHSVNFRPGQALRTSLKRIARRKSQNGCTGGIRCEKSTALMK